MSERFYFYLRINLKSEPDLFWKLWTAVCVWEACVITRSWPWSGKSGHRADGRAVYCAGRAQAHARSPTCAATVAQPGFAATLLSSSLSQSYTQHTIIQLPQGSHTGKEEKQVKTRSPSVRVFRDEEQHWRTGHGSSHCSSETFLLKLKHSTDEKQALTNRINLM